MRVVRYTHAFGGPDLIDPDAPILPDRDGWVRPDLGCWVRMALRQHNGYIVALTMTVSPFELPDHRNPIILKVVKRHGDLRSSLPVPQDLVPATDPGDADPLEHRMAEVMAFGLDEIVMAASL